MVLQLIRILLQKWQNSENYPCVQASQGEEARRRIHRRVIDVTHWPADWPLFSRSEGASACELTCWRLLTSRVCAP